MRIVVRNVTNQHFPTLQFPFENKCYILNIKLPFKNARAQLAQRQSERLQSLNFQDTLSLGPSFESVIELETFFLFFFEG